MQPRVLATGTLMTNVLKSRAGPGRLQLVLFSVWSAQIVC